MLSARRVEDPIRKEGYRLVATLLPLPGLILVTIIICLITISGSLHS